MLHRSIAMLAVKDHCRHATAIHRHTCNCQLASSQVVNAACSTRQWRRTGLRRRHRRQWPVRPMPWRPPRQRPHAATRRPSADPSPASRYSSRPLCTSKCKAENVNGADAGVHDDVMRWFLQHASAHVQRLRLRTAHSSTAGRRPGGCHAFARACSSRSRPASLKLRVAAEQARCLPLWPAVLPAARHPVWRWHAVCAGLTMTSCCWLRILFLQRTSTAASAPNLWRSHRQDPAVASTRC